MNPATNDKNPKQLHLYLRKVQTNLQLTHSKKEAASITQMIKKSALAYFKEHPDATFEDFENNFGSPENISANISDEDLQRNMQKLSFKKRFLQIILILAFLLTLLWAGLYVKTYMNTNDANLLREDSTIEDSSDK